jgi:hypothetical protein
MYLFSKFSEVKPNIGYRVFTQLQCEREQSLIQVVIVDLPRDLLYQKDSVDTLCELFMCIEFFSFGFQSILEPPLIEPTCPLLLQLNH